MEQLLSIKTVPIQIEMKVNHAKLEYARGTAELEINRDKGGLSIHSRPIRLNLDTFEARNSLSPTPFRSVEQAAQKGKNAVYEAMATAGPVSVLPSGSVSFAGSGGLVSFFMPVSTLMPR